MSGLKWVTGDVITFARMNQKTLIVQAAEPAIMYSGQMWNDIDDETLYQRNAANNAWTTVIKVGDAPTAHVLATTGPHTGTLPLTDLVVGARGEMIVRGVADWEALGVGVAGQVPVSGGPGADIAWGSAGVSFTDYHHYVNLAGAANYTLPSQAMSTMFVQLARMGNDAINVEFWDGGAWVSSINAAQVDIDDYWVGGITIYQDAAQSHRVINDGAARKISLAGVTWA